MGPDIAPPRAPLLDDAAYRRLLTALLRFFRSRRDPEAEDHAQEAITRILKNYDQGVEILNLEAYAHTVASNVWNEHRRRIGRAIGILQPSTSAFNEAEMNCLEQCMRRCLRPEERKLIQKYYVGEKSELIRNRQDLARQLGLTPGALRQRAHELRLKLEDCVRTCCGKGKEK